MKIVHLLDHRPGQFIHIGFVLRQDVIPQIQPCSDLSSGQLPTDVVPDVIPLYAIPLLTQGPRKITIDQGNPGFRAHGHGSIALFRVGNIGQLG